MVQLSVSSSPSDVLRLLLSQQQDFARQMLDFYPHQEELLADIQILIRTDFNTMVGCDLFEGEDNVDFLRVLGIGKKKQSRPSVQSMRQTAIDGFQVPFSPANFNVRPDPNYRRTPGIPFEILTYRYDEQRRGSPHCGQLVKKSHARADGAAVAERLDEMERDGIHSSHGWARRDLMSAEILNNNRWRYWYETIIGAARQQEKVLLKASTPYIDWFTQPQKLPMSHLYYCLDQVNPHWRDSSNSRWSAISYLFRWLLWSWGDHSEQEFPQDTYDGRVHDRLVQVFSPFPFALFPFDHFGQLLMELSDSTCEIPEQLPMALALKTTESMFSSARTSRHGKHKSRGFGAPDYRDYTFFDPEVGSGRLLLAASNYTMGGVGLDAGLNISPMARRLLTQAAKLNFWLYRPELIFPMVGFDPNLSDRGGRNCESWSFTAAKLKGIDWGDYFTQYEFDAKANADRPILRMRKRRVKSVKLNVDLTPARLKVAAEELSSLPEKSPQLRLGVEQPDVKLIVESSEDRPSLPASGSGKMG